MQSVSYRYPSSEDMMSTERLSPFDSFNTRWLKDVVDIYKRTRSISKGLTTSLESDSEK
jgi:hypothetical protein